MHVIEQRVLVLKNMMKQGRNAIVLQECSSLAVGCCLWNRDKLLFAAHFDLKSLCQVTMKVTLNRTLE